MGLTPSEDLGLVRSFRSGQPLGESWTPPSLGLFEDEGGKEKPLGDFPSYGGGIPLIISKRALDTLQPLISEDVEDLDIEADFGD